MYVSVIISLFDIYYYYWNNKRLVPDLDAVDFIITPVFVLSVVPEEVKKKRTCL